jgi:hypothetical protein
MWSQVKVFCKTCPQCQLWKRKRPQCGELPVQEAGADPWTEVHVVDMMGPLSMTTPSKKLSLLVFTAIDPATGWFKCIEVPNKESFTVMEAFNNHWLSRHPRLHRICFDNGTEFRSVFQEICSNYGLKAKLTTTYNPWSNGIIERVHQTLRDNLAMFELSNRELPEYDPFGSFLSAAAWAIRRTIHTTLQATPGQLVFGRDMLLNIPFKADWAAIQKRKQDLIGKGVVLRANQSRVPHQYCVGDAVFYHTPGKIPKMQQPQTGPHTVTQVYSNGTIRIRQGSVEETINIQNVTPYFT